ncbi:hypothetical protein GUITHDRAFT_74051 [Guillardia theta CCMP2712]|uniref:Uncharacterized protein n=1 Tax=Guillardia theta (strain CCMP2712) TaxID=905079 RepID=L1J1B2_GUITC|nr:hypothetical protein GUITHDRAFT_74051 [Guillardia theta CCMP2712]EKX42308.1 hypothetical protein GUITHDRAFT_74051 [Guillardia theta CCMP2712]|eukprot:XP_005829288.1 hypothetical protein GUITHDRAFT_74051 [Guillardia theta CCMP2712]
MALTLCLTARSLRLRGGEGEGEVLGPSRSFLGHNNTVLALAYHGGILYSGGLDHYVRLWDVRSGECVGKLEPNMHHGSIDTLLLKQSADSSSVLFSGDCDGMIRMWDANTDQSLGVLEGHTDAIYALLETEEPYSYIVSGSNDGTIRVWSLENLKCLTNTSYSRQTPVNALWMARSHGVLVSASADSLVRLWKPGTSFCIMTCKGHRRTIYALTGSLYVPRDGEVLMC